MTVDPALGSLTVPSSALLLEELNVTSNGVYLFDFDGVISTRLEDDIYKLPASDKEVQLIRAAAEHFRIRCDGMEQKYQRHLIFQASAWKLGSPIEPGPGFSAASAASVQARLFVTTARSGWYATERLRLFLQSHDITPIEVYNVGRVEKDRQIQLLCNEFPGQSVYLIEDSAAHLTTADQLNISNLSLVWVKGAVSVEEGYLRHLFCNTVEAALAL